MISYQEAIDFLYSQLPMFQRVGAAAYKPGLDTSLQLSSAFGDPHRHFPSIHVGGTNGKGSTAHSLAAVLQCAGYRTGLYTSPHLVDFRERIRVDGRMIPRQEVADFVERYRNLDREFATGPSFFELTMAMAFDYFARSHVDVAVIEVGMGGRLDSTNIITPRLSVITNISLDHTQFLGATRELIADEKAGIIKEGVPVVIGEADGEVRPVFEARAAEVGAPIYFAQDNPVYQSANPNPEGGIDYASTPFDNIHGELDGDCQPLNMATILTALRLLKADGWAITDEAVARGLASVCSLTGLMGRWMKLSDSPLVMADTGHNTGGWTYLAERIPSLPGEKHLILGFVADKDIAHLLDMMPRSEQIHYHFTRASLPRALDAAQLSQIAAEHGIMGDVYPTVAEAFREVKKIASPADSIFVGGSTFVVADLLTELGYGDD